MSRNPYTITIDEVYQLAADMGGSTYINTGEHDSDVMHNSCIINLNVLKTCSIKNVTKIFYSSSACVYPEYNQLNSPINSMRLLFFLNHTNE